MFPPMRKGVEPFSDGGIHAFCWSHGPQLPMHVYTRFWLHGRSSKAFQLIAVA